MSGSMQHNVSDEDVQLVFTTFTEFCLGRETDSFLVTSRQHQLM